VGAKICIFAVFSRTQFWEPKKKQLDAFWVRSGGLRGAAGGFGGSKYQLELSFVSSTPHATLRKLRGAGGFNRSAQSAGPMYF
jgi:hypothetical protein